MNYKEYFKKLEENAEYQKTDQELKHILDLADDILRLRMEKGWSQAELAERAGTKQANISRLESGLSNPSINFLQKVAKALDAEISIRFQEPLFFAINNSFQADFHEQKSIQIHNWPKLENVSSKTTTANKIAIGSF
jgi:transcriptional regulator with XRE-family HTH domain